MPAQRVNDISGIEPIPGLIEFAHFARGWGLRVGIDQAIDSHRALAAWGDPDRAALKSSLRTVFCGSKEDWDCFDDLFESFWSGRELTRSSTLQVMPDTAEPAVRSMRPSGTGPEHEPLGDVLFQTAASTDVADEENPSGLGASQTERLGKVDFSTIDRRDLKALEILSRRLLSQMTARLSRRLKIEENKAVDLRRTIRHSISRGGDPIDLSYKGRRKKHPRLLTFIDISGSMETHSLLFLQLAYFLQKHFRQARTVIFSTRPIDITRELAGNKIAGTFDSLSLVTAGWSGGTRIGESLNEFRCGGGAGLLSRDTVFIMFSDGLDTGEPDLLAEQMAAIKRSVRTVIWMNPLAGATNYRPSARGISAAMPYIDVFAPAHSVESLLQLERHLSGAIRR